MLRDKIRVARGIGKSVRRIVIALLVLFSVEKFRNAVHRFYNAVVYEEIFIAFSRNGSGCLFPIIFKTYRIYLRPDAVKEALYIADGSAVTHRNDFLPQCGFIPFFVHGIAHIEKSLPCGGERSRYELAVRRYLVYIILVINNSRRCKSIRHGVPYAVDYSHFFRSFLIVESDVVKAENFTLLSPLNPLKLRSKTEIHVRAASRVEKHRQRLV